MLPDCPSRACPALCSQPARLPDRPRGAAATARRAATAARPRPSRAAPVISRHLASSRRHSGNQPRPGRAAPADVRPLANTSWTCRGRVPDGDTTGSVPAHRAASGVAHARLREAQPQPAERAVLRVRVGGGDDDRGSSRLIATHLGSSRPLLHGVDEAEPEPPAGRQGLEPLKTGQYTG